MRAGPAVLTLLALAACGRGRDPGGLTASGHVEATEVRLSSKVPGRLVEVSVREGDRVQEGTVVARVDPTDLELLRRQVEAERGQALAERQLKESGYRKEDVAEAAARVRATEADLAAAERDFVRMSGLLERGSGTEKARDDARARRDSLRSKRDAERQALARLRSGYRSEEVEGARARVQALDARLAQIDQQIADAEVSSPLSGVVTEKVAESGEMVGAGTPIAVVTDLAHPWLTVWVAEPDLGRVRLGAAATVRTDGGDKRQGKVSFIASEAEFTPRNVQTRDERAKLVFKVKVALDNDDGLFKPGMPAEAELAPAAGGGR